MSTDFSHILLILLTVRPRFVQICWAVLLPSLSQDVKVLTLIYDTENPGCWLMAADNISAVYMAAGLAECCVVCLLDCLQEN